MYEQQRGIFLVTGSTGGTATYALPSARTATHTDGGLATNSTTDNHTGTITLTSGDQSYVLSRMVYDRAGRVVASAQDNGAVSTSAYDGADRLITQTDALGNTIQNQYDGNGNLTWSSRIEKATITEPAVTDEIFASAMRYDCLNRQILSAVQGPDGELSASLNECCTWPVQSSSLTSLSGYDSRGNQTLSIDPKGNTSITLFDGASRPIEANQHMRQNGEGTNPPSADQTLLAAGRATIRTQTLYDANSNVIKLIDDRGGATTYAYDTHDRQIKMTFHDGSTRLNEYDPADDVIQYTDGNTSEFVATFDALGQRTQVDITPADGINGTTSQSFQYDGLSRQTYSEDSAIDNAQVNTYNDSIGRVIELRAIPMTTRYITQTKLTSLVGSELTYPDGRKVTSEYDSLYRRTTIKETSSGETIASMQFIGPQRSVETTLANGITRTALNNGRTHSAVQSANNGNPAVPIPAWGTASSDRLGFDGSGRPITKRYLAGGINESTHAYNSTAPVVGQTTIYDRSSNKMYERALHAEPRSALYDPFDIDTGSSGGYDSANRLRQYQRGTLAATNGYLNQGGGQITAPIALPDTDTQRTYDLDGLGNWKHSNYTPVGGSATEDLRQHNKLNEITSRDRQGAENPQPNKTIFAYDGTPGASNGNLADDGTLLYSYDALNRLIEVKRKSDSAVIGQYVYDALNRRVSKTIANGGLNGDLTNGTTEYLYYDWQIIEERNSSNATTKQYVWGEYIDELIQMKTAVATGAENLPAGDYYPLQDLLYRNTALTDSAGAIVETYDTDAYGNTLIFKAAGTNNNWWTDDAVQTDNPACEIIYCGYRYDPETALCYVRHRTYNPVLGRWLQRDPVYYLELTGGLPQGIIKLINKLKQNSHLSNKVGYIDGMNLYEYVGSEPVEYKDMSGLYPCCSECQAAWDKAQANEAKELARKAASLGIEASGKSIIVGSIASGVSYGFWGGLIGAAVFGIIGGAYGLSAIIKYHAYSELVQQELQFARDSYYRCMHNCQ